MHAIPRGSSSRFRLKTAIRARAPFGASSLAADDAIDAAIAMTAGEVESGDRGVVGDEKFHEAATAAAHSSLLAKLMHEISGRVRETRIESLPQQDRPRPSIEGHKRIAEAVRLQDSVPVLQCLVLSVPVSSGSPRRPNRLSTCCR